VAPLLKHRSRHVADDAGAIPQNFLAWIPRRGLGQEGGGTGMENERRTLSRDNLPISELGGD